MGVAAPRSSSLEGDTYPLRGTLCFTGKSSNPYLTSKLTPD